jgi:hypothetical protein
MARGLSRGPAGATFARPSGELVRARGGGGGRRRRRLSLRVLARVDWESGGEGGGGWPAGMGGGGWQADLDNLVGIHPTVAEIFTTLSVTRASGQDYGAVSRRSRL